MSIMRALLFSTHDTSLHLRIVTTAVGLQAHGNRRGRMQRTAGPGHGGLGGMCGLAARRGQ